jgi:sigma-B regulation protein RsbU (phosphoserine phosphatase)
MRMAVDKSRTKDEVLRLKQALAQRESELEIINSVQQGLASRLEVQAIYNLVGDKIRDIFDAQVVMISTYDRQTDTIEHRYAIEQGKRVYAPGQFPIRGFRTQIVQTRQPVLVNDNVAKEAAHLGQPTLPGTITPKSWLGVPMMVGDQVRGVLSLQNVEQENAFTESDVRILQTLTASMSVALENARLWEQEDLYRKALEREFEIGREIQASFLPERLPRPRGWEIAASLKSARQVAGDFYDVFRLPTGRIGLVIADVCDKGLGAALFMTLFRSLIRAGANSDFFSGAGHFEGDANSARMKNAIHLTNNYIAGTHADTGMFATIFFGTLDASTGLLSYINAGALPPIVINKDGLKQTLERTGPAIGVTLDADYNIGDVELKQGDLLFAFTDGLTDAINNAGEYYNQMNLLSMLGGSKRLSAILEEIQNSIQSFAAGIKQQDDITLLAVKCKRLFMQET